MGDKFKLGRFGCSSPTMIRIGHFSDLHGNFKRISTAEVPDVWVNTGDFFPNMTRGDVAVEVSFQTAWFEANVDEIIAHLQGRPPHIDRWEPRLREPRPPAPRSQDRGLGRDRGSRGLRW